jgi:methyl-accepting chemotaxis protein
MRLIRSSLRAQLFAGFAAVTAVFLVGVVVFVSSLSSVTGTLDRGTARMRLADQLSTDTYNVQGSQLMNVLTNGARAANHANDLRALRANLALLDRALHSSADRADYARIVQAFGHWSAFDARVGVLVDAHRGAAAAALPSGRGAANQSTDALSAAAGRLASRIKAEDARLSSSSRSSATLTAILIGLLAVALAILVVLTLSRRIVGRLRQILQAARALALGDVEQRIDVRGQDEIGAMGSVFMELIEYLKTTAGAAKQIAAGNFSVEVAPRSDSDALGHAFIELRDRVGAVVRAISGTSVALNASSVQMASSTGEVGRAITEIAESVGSVAVGAEHQVRAVEEARAISEEVASVSRTSAANAAETAQAAAAATASAEAGESAVMKVDEAMRRVQASSGEVSSTMQALGEKSTQIGGIVDTITAIAEQTNLLALNAAIEAARAGEQGRGFAVVAEEVRKLAEESQRAAASIAGLIAEIQGETERAVVLVDAGSRQTDKSAQTVTAAREAFQQIRANVEAMTSRIELIAESSAQTVQSALRMQDSVNSVAAVAEQSSASTGEVSAATEQTSASTQQIASAAGELSGTAEELQKLVDQFTFS